MPLSRKYTRGDRCIGIGPVAAAFEGARAMVDIFYDNGEWGYYGLKMLAVRITEAYRSLMDAEVSA